MKLHPVTRDQSIHPEWCACTSCHGPRQPARVGKAGRAEFIVTWAALFTGCAAFWAAILLLLI